MEAMLTLHCYSVYSGMGSVKMLQELVSVEAHLQRLCKQAVLEQPLQPVRGCIGHRVHKDGLPLHCSLLVAHHCGRCRLQICPTVHSLQHTSALTRRRKRLHPSHGQMRATLRRDA